MLANIHSVKIEIFIPEEFIEPLREALNQAGAGQIGHYDNCSSVTQVTGYWRPLPGADPYNGEIGALTHGSECKVEINCPTERAAEAVRAARRVHPYEEPVINVVPLLSLE